MNSQCPICFSALDSVQSELFDVKSKYDEATSAKWVAFIQFYILCSYMFIHYLVLKHDYGFNPSTMWFHEISSAILIDVMWAMKTYLKCKKKKKKKSWRTIEINPPSFVVSAVPDGTNTDTVLTKFGSCKWIWNLYMRVNAISWNNMGIFRPQWVTKFSDLDQIGPVCLPGEEDWIVWHEHEAVNPCL